MRRMRVLMTVSAVLAAASCESEPIAPEPEPIAPVDCDPFLLGPYQPVKPLRTLHGDTLSLGGNGAKYHEVRKGSGPLVIHQTEALVHYTAYLADGARLGTTCSDRIPVVRPAGISHVEGSDVPPGVHDGVAGMNVGGLRRVIIPPTAIPYYQRQAGVSPDATLIYDIQLVATR